MLIIGGAAPLSSPGNPGTLAIDDLTIVPPAWRDVAQASLDQFRACQAHSYKGWVYLSPPAIFAPGDATGSYSRGTTTLLRDAHGESRISPEDLALAVVDGAVLAALSEGRDPRAEARRLLGLVL